jgi:hypothetical protein
MEHFDHGGGRRVRGRQVAVRKLGFCAPRRNTSLRPSGFYRREGAGDCRWIWNLESAVLPNGYSLSIRPTERPIFYGRI